jgi:hypothetical protein
MKRIITTISIGAACAGLIGCASVNQNLRTELTHPDGTKEVRETRNRTLAFWDARQTIEKLKASNGRTQAVGITGEDSNTSSTNTLALLQAIARIVEGVK